MYNQKLRAIFIIMISIVLTYFNTSLANELNEDEMCGNQIIDELTNGMPMPVWIS